MGSGRGAWACVGLRDGFDKGENKVGEHGGGKSVGGDGDDGGVPCVVVPNMLLFVGRLDGVWCDDEGETSIDDPRGGKVVGEGGRVEVYGAFTGFWVVAFDGVCVGVGGWGEALGDAVTCQRVRDGLDEVRDAGTQLCGRLEGGQPPNIDTIVAPRQGAFSQCARGRFKRAKGGAGGKVEVATGGVGSSEVKDSVVGVKLCSKENVSKRVR